MQSQLIISQSEAVSGKFKNSVELQDVITKRILESKHLSDIEEELPASKISPEYAAKAK